MTPQDFALLMSHERRVLDAAYEAAQAGRTFMPVLDYDKRMASRLTDMGFLAYCGAGGFVPTGPNISDVEGVV